MTEIGAGPTGHVWLGKRFGEAGEEQTPAIKVFQPSSGAVQQHKESFLREMHTLKQLHHPHILPILDAGVERGIPYIITPYASGGSLRDRMQPARPLQLAEALRILTQVAQAIQYAHYHNVLHCNLKPQNILFNARGDALVNDFSIAALPTMLQGSSSLASVYLAPEQFVGIVSKESDQYALGGLAYELLTGHPPFEGRPGPHYAVEQLVPPTQLNPALPSYVDQAILKAMAKGLTQRHSDIQAFLNALSVPAPIIQSAPPPAPEQTFPAQQGALFLPNPETRHPLPPTPTIVEPPHTPAAIPALSSHRASSGSLFAYAPQPGSSKLQANRPPRAPQAGLYSPRAQPFVPPQPGVPNSSRGQITREQALIFISCMIVLATLGGLLFYVLSATRPQPISLPVHTVDTSPATATSAPSPSAGASTVTVTMPSTPASTPIPVVVDTPTATPLPTPTATAPPENLLTSSPGQLNTNTCRSQGSGYRCTVTLMLNAAATKSVSWHSATSGIYAIFNPSRGTLNPGKSIHITVYIFNNCKTRGTLTFSGSDMTTSAQWGC